MLRYVITIVLITMLGVGEISAQSAKSDSLFAIGVELYNAGKYQDAIPIFMETDELDKKRIGSSNQRWNYSAMWLAACYRQLGDTITAKSLSNYSMISPVDRRLTMKSDSLFLIGIKYYKINDYKSSLSAFQQCAEIEKIVLGKEHPWYGNTISYCAFLFDTMSNYSEAIRLETEALYIKGESLGEKHPDYATSLSKLADYNSSKGDYTAAIKLGTEALQIREQIYGKEHSICAVSLNSLALLNSYIGNYSEAVRLGSEAVQITEKILGKNHPNYAISLSNLALFNSYLEKYSEAVRLGKEAMQIQERITGKDNPDYAILLSKVAGYNLSLGNYSEAIDLGKEVLQIFERTLGKEHPKYAISLGNLAHYISNQGNYSEAIRLETETLQIQEKTLGREHPEYAISLRSLADFNFLSGNYSEAVRLGKDALQIQEKTIGREHPQYATSLGNLSLYISRQGNYSEAIRLATEALQIQERTIGKESLEYALMLDKLADYNSSNGNYTEAIQLGKEALRIQRKILGYDHPGCAISLNNLAVINASLGNYSEAIQLGKEALQIQEKTLGREHPEYATSLHNLALSNSYVGNYSEAIQLGKEALQIQEKALGKEHPSYTASLGNLTWYYFKNRDISALESHSLTYYSSSCNIIRKNFADLLEHERELFWNKYQNAFQMYLHRYSFAFPTDNLINCGYNATLLCKGLLLNLSRSMSELIQSNGEKETLLLYEKLKSNRLMLQKMYEKPIVERKLNMDSLEVLTDKLERELLQKSKVYGDYMKDISIQWEDVQTKLGQKDVSVEFVSFPYTNDSTMYVAYVLKKEMTSPKMIPLFEEKQIKKGESLYKNSSVSKLVWEPLAEYLDGVQNVYFAPAGELYNIGIEYLFHWSGEGRMSEKWNMYRLSSTRQLAVIKDKNALKQASVYGGVKYETKEDLLVADSRKYRSQERSFNYEPFAIADSLNLRAGASYLPATKTEAEEIDKTLEQKKIMTKLLIDSLATEGAFKDLSGKKTNLLHIATHGFYWTETEAKYKDNLNFLMLNDNNQRYIEDKALTRSGLLLAGANNALMGKKLPEGVDDGILTAKEISQLDLRGLDLVVLSACETGLGEIKGDGVFGLQRGFKKAGANSLLMSLWKVDDNATQLLMTQFYKNLTSGMSKFESLRQAQKYVRDYEVEVEVKSETRPAVSAHAKEQAQQNANKEKAFKKVKKYEDPKYWAAFILLDAID